LWFGVPLDERLSRGERRNNQMAFRLTNLTQSLCNVPYNPIDGQPKYVVPPNASVTITSDELSRLDPEVRDRLLTITTGPNPIFKVEDLDQEPAQPKKAGKSKKGKTGKTDVAAAVFEGSSDETYEVAESVIETTGEEVEETDAPDPVSDTLS
jgi:hypothetical protein